MYADTCTCPSQKLCKHRKAVAHYFNVADFSVLPESDAFAMVKYHFMAHGSCEPAHWYRQFNDNTDVKKLEQLIEKLKTEEEQAATVECQQRAVATLHQKIKKQNNGNIEAFKRSVICLKWDTKHQFKLAKAEKGRMVGLFPIPVLVCYHTQDPESFFTEETELQLSDEDSMNLTY